jgi:hypothetical protein
MHNCFPRFVLTIIVQNVPLRMTDMATGNDVTPKGGEVADGKEGEERRR